MFVVNTADGKSRAVGNQHGRGPPQYRRNVPAELYEPIDAVVTADSTFYTADNATWPTADGGILEGATDVVEATVVAAASAILETAAAADALDATTVTGVLADEPADALDALDAIVIAVGVVLLAEPAAAADALDAEVIPASAAVGGGAPYPPLRPFPVVGVGFGVLPRLKGEAFGDVGAVGDGLGTLPRLAGAADGTVGIAGRSAGQLVIRATALGQRGAVAKADAVLKGLSVASSGVVAVRGSGSGVIVKLEATASGRHDDDEAAVMAFLLAA